MYNPYLKTGIVKGGIMIVCLFLIPAFSFYINAQSIRSLKGTTSASADDFYYVSILSSSDSSVIDTRYFDTPDFSLDNIKTNEFILQISSPLLFKTYSRPVSSRKDETIIDVGFIELEPNTVMLNEIMVTTSVPKMKFSDGKFVFDIHNNTDFRSLGSLDEIFKRLPFVKVEDGKISVLGKRNTLILINGVPPKNNNWEMMSPDDIKDVEIVTNPSAEYNAQGMAVINIITKRKSNEGFSGTLSSNVSKGESWRSGNTLQLNYATGKINLYARGNYFIYKKIYKETYDRHFPNGIEIHNRLDSDVKTTKDYSMLFGTDYLIDARHTVGIQYQRISTPYELNSVNTNFLTDGSQQRKLETLINRQYERNNSIYDLNYTFEIDSVGKKFSMNAGYVDYSTTEDSRIEEISNSSTGLKEGSSVADISVLTVQADYIHKTAGNFTGKAGLYFSHNKNKSSNKLLNMNGGISEEVPQFNNSAHIDEKKFATYITGRKGWDKFYVSAGLRYERLDYSNKNTDSEIKNKVYNDFFPSLEAGFEFGEKLQTNISFSRKVHYPAFQDLSPTVNYVDTLTYYMGNINLRPEYSYNLGLNVIYNRYFTLSLSYSKVDDPLHPFFVKRLNPNSIILLATTENLISQDIWTASLTAPFAYKRWTMQTSAGINYNRIKFESEGVPQNREKPMVYFYTYQGLKLPNKFNFSVIYQYNSSGQQGIFRHESRHILNLGINKSFLDDKLILSLRYDDILKNDKQRMTVNLPGINLAQSMKYDASYATLSIKYTFGSQSSKKYKIKENTKEELKRIKE